MGKGQFLKTELHKNCSKFLVSPGHSDKLRRSPERPSQRGQRLDMDPPEKFNIEEEGNSCPTFITRIQQSLFLLLQGAGPESAGSKSSSLFELLPI